MSLWVEQKLVGGWVRKSLVLPYMDRFPIPYPPSSALPYYFQAVIDTSPGIRWITSKFCYKDVLAHRIRIKIPQLLIWQVGAFQRYKYLESELELLGS